MQSVARERTRNTKKSFQMLNSSNGDYKSAIEKQTG